MFTTTKPWSNLDVSTSRSSITTVFGSTIPSEPGRKGHQVLGIWWAPDDGHRLMTQDLEKIQGSLFDPTPYLPKKSPVFRWLLSIDVFFPKNIPSGGGFIPPIHVHVGALLGMVDFWNHNEHWAPGSLRLKPTLVDDWEPGSSQGSVSPLG